jgi:hypothetical protein
MFFILICYSLIFVICYNFIPLALFLVSDFAFNILFQIFDRFQQVKDYEVKIKFTLLQAVQRLQMLQTLKMLQM